MDMFPTLISYTGVLICTPYMLGYMYVQPAYVHTYVASISYGM